MTRAPLSSIAGFMVFPRHEIVNGRERIAFYTAMTQWGSIVEGTEELKFTVDPAGLFDADGNFFFMDLELTEPLPPSGPDNVRAGEEELEPGQDEHGNFEGDPAYGSGMDAEAFARHCEEVVGDDVDFCSAADAPPAEEEFSKADRADSMGAALATAPYVPRAGVDYPPEGWTPSYQGDQSWRGKGHNPGSGYDG